MKIQVTAYIIDANRVNVMLGRETIKEWKLSIDHEEDKLELKEKGKKVELIESKGGHLIAQLELVGKWEDKDVIYLVEKEYEVKSDKAIKKIHKILNHKSKEQMQYAFRNAGKLDEETKEKINEIVENCDVCKKNSKSNSKPDVYLM